MKQFQEWTSHPFLIIIRRYFIIRLTCLSLSIHNSGAKADKFRIAPPGVDCHIQTRKSGLKKMIISFNGDHGSGKSTIAKMVAEELNYPRYYMGQIFRDIAKEKGITLEELHEGITDDLAIDKLVDDYLVDLSEKENDFVVESRTAWHFIPKSIKFYFRVDSKESARRVFLELQKENQRNEGTELDSIEKVEKSLDNRKKMDDERYLKFYGINIRDDKNYDLVIDTTSLAIQEVFEKVMSFIKSKINDQSH